MKGESDWLLIATVSQPWRFMLRTSNCRETAAFWHNLSPPLTPGKNQLDLGGFSPEAAEKMQAHYVSARIDLEQKAAEIMTDLGELANTLSTFNEQAESATQANISFTASHRQKIANGEREIMFGTVFNA